MGGLNNFILASRARLRLRLILTFSTLKKMYALDETTSAFKLISNVVTLRMKQFHKWHGWDDNQKEQKYS